MKESIIPSKFEEWDLHNLIYWYLVSLQENDESKIAQIDEITFITADMTYWIFEHPDDESRQEYIAILWEINGPLEIFSIHKEGLQPLVEGKYYDSLSRTFKTERIV